jgi:hypothetical protein
MKETAKSGKCKAVKELGARRAWCQRCHGLSCIVCKRDSAWQATLENYAKHHIILLSTSENRRAFSKAKLGDFRDACITGAYQLSAKDRQRHMQHSA